MIMSILPLLLFTTTSGIAAGAYLIETIRTKGKKNFGFGFPLTCLILLGIGLCGTLLHLGQPLRFINGLSNPASMISQEAYWSIAFGILLLVDTVITKIRGGSSILSGVTSAVGLGLVVVTSLAYFNASGIAAWSTGVTVLVFAIGDLALGIALCLSLEKDSTRRKPLMQISALLQIVWLFVVAAYALHLNSAGYSFTFPLIGAAVVGIGGSCAMILYALAKKQYTATAAIVASLLMVVGVIVVRIVFFAAGIGH